MKLKFLTFLFLMFCSTSLIAETKAEFYEILNQCRQGKWPPVAHATYIGHHEAMKFFIEHGEDVNARTNPVYYTEEPFNDNASIVRLGYREGILPLEIALRKKDETAIRILLEHNPNNPANPELGRDYLTCYQWNKKDDLMLVPGIESQHCGDCSRGYAYPLEIALQNKISLENVKLILEHYTTTEMLLKHFPLIKRENNIALMKSWIQTYEKILKGEVSEVDDQTCLIFIENDLTQAIKEKNVTVVSVFVQHGWLVTLQHIKQALLVEDASILEILVSGKLENPVNALREILKSPAYQKYADFLDVEKAFQIAIEQDRIDLVSQWHSQGHELNTSYLILAIEHNAISSVKFFIDQNIPTQGALLAAVKHNRFEIASLLLEIPATHSEIKEASLLAYQLGYFDLLELLELKS